MFKLIDTEKTIGLKMKGTTRVYPSPSILSDIKSIREEIIIEEDMVFLIISPGFEKSIKSLTLTNGEIIDI